MMDDVNCIIREEEWGGMFQMNPQKVRLTEETYEKMAEAVRQALKAKNS